MALANILVLRASSESRVTASATSMGEVPTPLTASPTWDSVALSLNFRSFSQSAMAASVSNIMTNPLFLYILHREVPSL
jgi:hypothetical protein